MPTLSLTLAVSSFISGLLMFFAPCTLPLVPAYLSFISGTKEQKNSTSRTAHARIIRASLAFIIGFTVTFVLFGALAGLLGYYVTLLRTTLTYVGGVFIIVFGLLMLDVLRIKPLMRTYNIALPSFITPGKPGSAFAIGVFFALGWTPCIGPVLATVLLLASTAGTVTTGAFLLLLFSLGLAVPFLCTAFLYQFASDFIERYAGVSKAIQIIGGLFLICIGVLLLTDSFGLLVTYGTQLFTTLGLGSLFELF